MHEVGGKPGHVLSGCDFRVARSREDMRAAFQLVYQNYLMSGLSKEIASGMRVTSFHALPSTDVLVAVQGGRVNCTATLIRDGDMGLPIERVYPDEVAQFRESGSVIAEVGCLAQRGNQLSVLLRLINFMAQRSRLQGINHIVIAVHPRHVKFYERYLGFSTNGPLRSYHAVCGHPAMPLVMNLNDIYDQNRRACGHLYGPPFPLASLIAVPLAARLRTEISAWARQVSELSELCA